MEVKKHLFITGTSTVSWKDAIVKTIAEASKSIDYLSFLPPTARILFLINLA